MIVGQPLKVYGYSLGISRKLVLPVLVWWQGKLTYRSNGSIYRCLSDKLEEKTIIKQISISSDAFNDGSSLPVEYTCDGEDRSPALSWDTVPAGTQSIALIVDDLDATAGQASQVFLQGICPGYHTQLKERCRQIPA